MPTSDRRPRARRRAEVEQDGLIEILRLLRAAGDDPAAWAALRSRAIRTFKSGKTTAEQAVAMFEAFRKRPDLLPTPPPANPSQ